MKKPLPLSDLADMLDACENSQVTVAIRAAFATPGADRLAAVFTEATGFDTRL